jgi:hypothetical protein
VSNPSKDTEQEGGGDLLGCVCKVNLHHAKEGSAVLKDEDVVVHG